MSPEARERLAGEKMTIGQKNYMIVLLKRVGLLDAKLRGGRTGPQWRKLFSIAGTKEPSLLDFSGWPTADEWIDSLTMPQAHEVLRHLKKLVGERPKGSDFDY